MEDEPVSSMETPHLVDIVDNIPTGRAHHLADIVAVPIGGGFRIVKNRFGPSEIFVVADDFIQFVIRKRQFILIVIDPDA